MATDEPVNEIFIMYPQRINESMVDGNEINEEASNENDRTANDLPNAHPKSALTKPRDMGTHIGLKDCKM